MSGISTSSATAPATDKRHISSVYTKHLHQNVSSPLPKVYTRSYLKFQKLTRRSLEVLDGETGHTVTEAKDQVTEEILAFTVNSLRKD